MITLFKDPLFQTLDSVFETPKQINQPKITRTDEDYQVHIAVPGLTKDDLTISTKEGYLNISYVKEETDDKTYSFTSSFKKTYHIPDDVDEKHITGSVENGVLEIILPKSKKKSSERLISLT
jgi:HSP20 family protein